MTTLIAKPETMAHDHAHGTGSDNETSLRWAFGLTAIFLIAEVIGGVLAQSLALISDAAHMFTDTVALAIAQAANSWKAGLGWWLLGLTVAVADWIIKDAVQRELLYGEIIPITAFFNLVHVWNTGAAFSFLADAGGWQRYFLTAVALGAVVVLGWMLMRPQRRLDAVAYSLILGGALGNAVDRIARGYVVDYLDFHWASWHWPAFNLADVAICTAAALLIWTAFKQRNKATDFAHEVK